MKVSLYCRIVLRTLGVVIFCLCQVWSAFATHMRAGNIIVEKVGPCSARTYRITIVAYIDTESGVPFGGSTDFLYFGVGTERVVLPEVTQQSVKSGQGWSASWTMIDATRHIARVTYSTEYTYPGADTYTISYIEVNRNQGVLNMDQSVDTPFYVETRITIDPYLGCSTPAKIDVPPVDRACSGVAWFHNPGAYDDEDGDSLSYKLVTPFSNRNQEVLNYRDPNSPGFYTNYNTGNETHDGVPTFTQDPVRGTIVWDAPGAAGEYNIAFHIIEWRKKDGKWYQVGYVRRDMQIIVEDNCNNMRPDLEVPEDICVRAGEVIDETIIGTDPDNNDVQLEAFSEVLGANFPNPATVTPDPPVYQPASSAKLRFHWQTTCEHVKDQPYQVVLKVTDRPTNGSPQLATFKSWQIRVVGPEPEFTDRSVNTSTRSVTLQWKPYICQQAETMQIWRRVDSVQFVPDKCETGMPPNLGYTLIDQVPVKNGSVPVVQYVDDNDGKGLAPGARYCYRLVAIYPQPKGGESIVSSDTCINPIITNAPLITNVSILKTDAADGQVKVKWFKPQLATLPPPYKYEVYRAEGDERGGDSTLVATIPSSSAPADSIVDTGINTEEKIYNYSVTAYSGTDEMGSATAASTVRLETQSQIGTIVLNWRATVPWSNQITGYKHRIYRGDENSTDDNLVLIDSVEVTADGFTYEDAGQFNNTPLEDGKIYCYKVETVGSYGNPDLPPRLFNFSEMICTQPGDSIPPCALVLDVTITPCEEYQRLGQLCQGQGDADYKNTISWTRPDDAQCSDIQYYEVWVSNQKGAEFVYLSDKYRVPATSSSFTDPPEGVDPLLSFARCYKLRAVDRSGNKGEFSNEVCSDNCPMYRLPNVFTPNNNDNLNDVFSAYNIRRICREGIPCPELTDDQREYCARFVEDVTFTVYNRWGQKVYDYKSGGENTIFIDWDGRDNSGSNLPSGVYFYMAEVTFDVVDPSEKVKIFKGWVHLLDGSQ